MKYFKLINNNTIIGVVTSNNFIKYYSITDCYLKTNELVGEYVSYKGQLYRSEWMQPFYREEEYQLVSIVAIDKEEYDIYLKAIIDNEPIEEIIPQPINEIPEEQFNDEINQVSIDFVRTSKINEMSRTCNQVIEAGFDIELGGKVEHFSLTTQDQLNLISLSSMAANGMEAIPYHADGEICRFYSNAEMQAIVAQATAYKIYHTTYYNALKNYINSLDTIEEIAAVTYGMPLPEEYQSDVLKSLQK